MIRVLEVLATLKPAGAEQMVLTLLAGLDRSRFAATVVSLYDAFPGGLDCAFREAGATPLYLGKRPGFDPRMFARLRRVIASVQPHILHSHSYVMRYTAPAALLARSRARQVHTVHNLAGREVDRIGALLHRLAFGHGVVPVAVGDQVARSFASQYGFAPEVIRNGIDLSRFAGAGMRESWRAANGFTREDLLVVSVARLEPQKNPHALLRAFAEASVPGARLLLVGQGSLAAELQAFASDTVRFLGARADIPAILAAADVFALASDWEGYPVAVLEAMASGLPVCATAAGGVPEAVEHEVTGLLVPPGDRGALALGLRRLLTDASLRAALGEAARARAQQFSAQSMVRGYEALFERMAGA